MSRPVRAPELDDERDEEMPPGSEPVAAARTGAAGAMARIQASAGNAAAQRLLSGARLARAGPPPPPPPGAVTHHTTAEIKAMTLKAFDTHAKDQADWALDPGVAPEKELLQTLLEFARAKEGGIQPVVEACGDQTVQALLDTGLDAAAREELRVYARAVKQTSLGHPTVKIEATDDVGKARTYGQALRKLEATPGGVTIHKIFNLPEALDRLLAKAGALDAFIAYCNAQQPVLEAEDDQKTSVEITSFLDFYGAGDQAFVGRLPDVRNLHRFEHAALQRLSDNLALSLDQVRANAHPLVLLLHSSFDHNGAFHRDPNLTTVITQGDKLVLMIEGKATLAEMQGQLAGIAARYGHDGKIHEVMLAGHGESHSIQMAGTMDATGAEAGQDVKTKDAASDAFIKELVANMATGPDTRIVLNACLTASNQAIPGTVSGRLSNDPATAANEVHAAIQADPSLKDSIAVAAGKDRTVKGSNASFGQVGLLDAAGHLDILDQTALADTKLTGTKEEYAREGKEPQGTMRALLEVWKDDQRATPKGAAAAKIINDRADSKDTDWWGRIIGAMYRAIKLRPNDAELMRNLAEAAGSLADLGGFKNPDSLGWLPSDVADAILTDVSGADEWTSEPKLPLMVYQHWQKVTPAKGATFKAHLAANFTCRTAREFVVWWNIAADMPRLLPVGTPAPAKGDLALALLGTLLKNDKGEAVPPDPEAARFLKQVAAGSKHFDAALGIDALLDKASSQDEVESAIGLVADVPAATPALPPNTDLNGDGTPDVYIEPMERTTARTKTWAHLHSRPVKKGHGVDWTKKHGRLILTGKSGEFYVVEHGTKPRFVHQDDIVLGDKPNTDIDGDGVNDFHVESITRRGAVTATHLNVRQYPGLDERIMASIAKGVEVFVEGTSDDWYAIEHGGKTRFVHKDWLELKATA